MTCLDLGVAEQSFGVVAAKRSGFAKDACPETLQRELGPGAWDKSLSMNLNQAELACSRSCLWQVSSRPACLEESCRLVQGGHTVLFCGNAEPRLFLKHPHSEWNKDRGSLEKSARQQIRFAFIAGVLFVVGVGLKRSLGPTSPAQGVQAGQLNLEVPFFLQLLVPLLSGLPCGGG